MKLFITLYVTVLFSQMSFAKTLNGFDVSNSIVPITSIVHGGPPRDGIPAILRPRYVRASKADFLQPEDMVLGFEYQGETFAFPRYILNWHELVNGEVNGHPFLISYCPLCGTGMAFSSKLDGSKLIFGVSGLLYNSDVIFYDKQTESLWSQIERRAISGRYVGKFLQQLYLTTTTWAKWLEDHPTTQVLSEHQGVKRNYRHDPYSGYETSSRLFFKVLRKAPNDYHTKERVMGVQLGAQVKAYPYAELRRNQKSSFEDDIGGKRFRIFWDEEHETASIETLGGEKITSTVAFWFAWYAFHPQTEVYRSSGLIDGI